jgi:hypothetical protein
MEYRVNDYGIRRKEGMIQKLHIKRREARN